MNWKAFSLPMDEKFVYNLRSSGKNLDKPGIFFRGNFMINSAAGVSKGDTFIDVTNFTKGIVWVNGHNLGRYWNIGPQKRLYCPASFLREGMNEVMIFDLHETSMKMVTGWKTME
ncbi:MAG: beta-galactosidase, partial [Chloroflexota bacterium]